MKNYLLETEIIDYSDPAIISLANDLKSDCKTELDIVEKCFIYVRDEIAHTGDIQSPYITMKASEVLKYKVGWCYAKSHLLAALLRYHKIPTGFCYQRLRCDEYTEDSFCLHGLNAVYLNEFGWYKIDARGNKEGVDAQCIPPDEKLAFTLQEGESNIDEVYDTPLNQVVKSLAQDYDEMIHNFPDIQEN